MRLILVTFSLAIVLGYLLGGRLRNLGSIRLRLPWVGLAAVGLQLVPANGPLGSALLFTSFALLLVVGVANRRVPGFGLVVAGLCLNFLVIAVNDGMPVTAEAVVASGQADTLDDLRAGGAKHHLATADDELLFLADRFGIPHRCGRWSVSATFWRTRERCGSWSPGCDAVSHEPGTRPRAAEAVG